MTVRAQGVSVHPIIYGNISVFLVPTEREGAAGLCPQVDYCWSYRGISRDQTGGADDLARFIKRNNFKTHETYPQLNRSIEAPPFELSAAIPANPTAAAALVAIPPSRGPIHASQYDEIQFRRILHTRLLWWLSRNSRVLLDTGEEEAERLEDARKSLVEEELIEMEKELERIRAGVEVEVEVAEGEWCADRGDSLSSLVVTITFAKSISVEYYSEARDMSYK
ncbi:hypothetical protein BDV93DRAFT_549047 [Ceratobasidium sp. AG-I]|nr:hypothetical protein BDV93DRAFT_549047 [Ceratobasidium sp. AG-I]